LPFSLIPFLFLLIPIAEITVFVLVGSQIGVLPTLALVILTAVAGSILLRWQGLTAMTRIQTELAAGRVPGKELVNGVMILLAGMLLMTPGFVTDVLGLLLFVPPIRDLVWRFLSKRVTFQTFGSRRFGDGLGGERADDANAEPDIVDLDEDEYQRHPDRKSPWSIDDGSNHTRH
jgi:UPF0716 protein FxsA